MHVCVWMYAFFLFISFYSISWHKTRHLGISMKFRCGIFLEIYGFNGRMHALLQRDITSDRIFITSVLLAGSCKFHCTGLVLCYENWCHATPRLLIGAFFLLALKSLLFMMCSSQRVISPSETHSINSQQLIKFYFLSRENVSVMKDSLGCGLAEWSGGRSVRL